MPSQDLRPTLIPPALRPSAWRGGGLIQSFRHDAGPTSGTEGEEWLGCTLSLGSLGGRTELSDGRRLADLVDANPTEWLGAEHVRRHGTDPTFVVKLVDAGHRLFLHVHPDRRWAAARLGSHYGKAEGWVILAAPPDGVVHLGFSRDVAEEELAGWVAEQDTRAMVAATNVVPVQAGDAIFCPGGLPHAIGAGILMAEVQEPTDLTVLLEWRDFDVDGMADGHLGMGFASALQCVDRRHWTAADVAGLVTRSDERPRDGAGHGVTRLFGERSAPFFTVERIEPADNYWLQPAFSVLVVVSGSGALRTSRAGGLLALRSGDVVVVPFGAGEQLVTGSMSVLRFTSHEAWSP